MAASNLRSVAAIAADARHTTPPIASKNPVIDASSTTLIVVFSGLSRLLFSLSTEQQAGVNVDYLAG